MIKAGETGWLIKQTPSGKVRISISEVSVSMYSGDHLRNETIMFYEHAWVAIMQSDASFEVARID